VPKTVRCNREGFLRQQTPGKATAEKSASYQFVHDAAKDRYPTNLNEKFLSALFCTQPESTPQ
jgi:hypothetical protein